MSKLYFDCPIQALYMMKEFGVICDLDNLNLSNQSSELLPLSELMALKKIYVSKESEHIFEPKLFDWGKIKEMPSCFVKYNGNEWKEIYGGGYRTDNDGSEIVMRDGKQFFSPKSE
jgi:hypothetical protein